MFSQLVEEILLGMEREHDCGISPACPAWLCETITNKLEMEKEIEKLTVHIRNWKIEEEALGHPAIENADGEEPSWGVDKAV